MRDIEYWRALQPEAVQPRQSPDGLLEVRRRGAATASLFIIEITSAADNRVAGQVLDDLMLIYQDRRVLPEIVSLVLQPKGQVQVSDHVEVRSQHGFTMIRASWRLVELWRLSAAEALQLGEPGLMPWVPLMTIEGPPEPVLEQCRRVIDEKTTGEDNVALRTVSQFLGRMRYSKQLLWTIFGGSNAMIESPFIQDLIEELGPGIEAKATRRSILAFLEARFATVLPEIPPLLDKVTDEARLGELTRFAALCPDLESFRRRLEA